MALFLAVAASVAAGDVARGEGNADTQGPKITDEQVVASMKKGIDYLLKIKKGDNWERGVAWNGPAGIQKGGGTAQALYTLLHAGESLQDDPEYHAKLNWRGKELSPAVHWLEKNIPDQTYVAAVEACALTLLPKIPNEKPGEGPKVALDACRNYLITAMDKDGGYTYGPMTDAKKHAANYDLSNSQYGALGAWALMDYGMEMPNSYWQVTDSFWRQCQRKNGAWPYWVKTGLSFANDEPAMGVAGIATLFVAQEFTDTELRLTPRPDKNIELGLAWLNREFKPDDGDLYYLYGVERVGLASGFKFFGTTNWYETAAANIVKMQDADGSWKSRIPGVQDPDLLVPTSYALLFLSRGRNPVVFNKLQYTGPWNARPRDDAYVTRWMSKRFEKPINWQVVNLQVNPEEWLDAPILLITGSEDPKFTRQDLAKLREFIHAGGMIFSTADGGKDAFTQAIRKYAGEIVDKQYEMRVLPRNHPLFSKDMGVDLPNPPPLLGLSNGVRELWIHSTQDIGADWQMRKFSSKNFELSAALYFYASGMGSLRSKLQPLAVEAAKEPPARTIDVALLDYPGNASPEPGAWPRMAKLAAANFKTQVNLNTIKFAELDARKNPLAHLTGTARVTFTPEDIQALKAYLDAGGLLFIDAAGGNADFTDSCRTLIKQMYPDETLSPLPADHPIYTGSMPDGKNMESVDFRKFGNLTLHRRVTAPAIEAIIIAGRPRILFSPWDICSGFLGTNTWGIVGYSPATSEMLGRNILLYALGQVAPTAPAKPPVTESK